MMRAGVVGWPISHSKSPIIHGHWIVEHDLDAEYKPIALQPGEFDQGIANLKAQGFKGCNVTIPHKEAAFDLCDRTTDRAQSIGAVNTLIFREGEVHGDNTDGIGFLNNIRSSCPEWTSSAGPTLVIGAGGAARAIVWALKEVGCPEIRIWNRTTARAEALADAFGPTAVAVSSTLEVASTDAEFVVNTSSLGMVGQPKLIFDVARLHPNALVTDIVYTPLETDLLAQARASGRRTVDGLGMLLHQAVPGFEAWFGVRPAVTDALRTKVLAA